MTAADRYSAIAAHGRAIAAHVEALGQAAAMPEDLQAALILAGAAMHQAADLAREAAQAATEAAGRVLH